MQTLLEQKNKDILSELQSQIATPSRQLSNEKDQSCRYEELVASFNLIRYYGEIGRGHQG